MAGETSDFEESSYSGSFFDDFDDLYEPLAIENLPLVRPTHLHAVLHIFPIEESSSHPPKPWKSEHKWDEFHVRLPHANANGVDKRWTIIEATLRRPIRNVHELQAAILTYNEAFQDQWDFRALHELFENVLIESEKRMFFEDLLKRIINMALRLPELVTAPIPLLRQRICHSITLTQEQISCLLANAFLCTYPGRNMFQHFEEYIGFPDIHFERLFQSSASSDLEKLKCILHYFRRVCPQESSNEFFSVPTGCITFERRFIKPYQLPKWSESTVNLAGSSLHINSQESPEDHRMGLLQLDFANNFVGNGILGCDCGQEEMSFAIYPELMVARLFTESLTSGETLKIMGCERYSDCKGYGKTFRWLGNHQDATPCDESRRRKTCVVIIEALPLHQLNSSMDRGAQDLILRELNNVYAGFQHPFPTMTLAIATCMRKCCASGGDPELKALLQLMACAVTERSVVYFIFDNEKLMDEVYKMYVFVRERNVLVKELWAIVEAFYSSKVKEKCSLYPYLYSKF